MTSPRWPAPVDLGVERYLQCIEHIYLSNQIFTLPGHVYDKIVFQGATVAEW